MKTAKLTPFTKLLIFVAAVFAITWGGKKAIYYGLVPRPTLLKSVVPVKAEVVTAEVLQETGSVKSQPLPSKSLARSNAPKVNFLIWAWNAQMAFIYANGGPETTQGSAMARHGQHIEIRRQDDTEQMKAELMTFAQALHDGQDNPQVGAHFVNIMGDGAAQFFASLNPKLEKLGPEYHAEIVGAVGYSRGEDGFWGMPAWKIKPESAKGGLVIGVLRDGDWNIAMDWLHRNNIPNNPDEKSYDENSLNWVNADSYTKAAEMYVQGYCEDRPLKNNPSQKKHICAGGVVTWTPGDVTIAKKRGGLVPLLTTQQNTFQMPSVMIGIHKWNQSHAANVSAILASTFEAADQIKTNPAALQKAAEYSAQIYKEEKPEYWLRYYRGVDEADAQGRVVHLGGSSVINLADALQLFGISGGINILKATYETFGNIVVQQYPTLVPSYPKLSQVEDASYVLAARDELSEPSGDAEKMSYSATADIKDVGGKRNYEVQFRTGSAEILSNSFHVLDGIYQDASLSNYEILIDGYTDNTGTPDGNLTLSAERAASVKRYLQSKSDRIFPSDRIRTAGHGQEDALASNASAEGRAQNRRVQITLASLAN